jgi:hypothetical protein
MKLALPILALLVGAGARADPQSAVILVGLSDGGQYRLVVARDGMPTNLTVRDGYEAVEIRLRFADAGKLRYDIKRSGARPFSLEGEMVPHGGLHSTIVGHLPFGRSPCDVRLGTTDD